MHNSLQNLFHSLIKVEEINCKDTELSRIWKNRIEYRYTVCNGV